VAAGPVWSAASVLVSGVVIRSGLAALVAMARAAGRIFWADSARIAPRVRLIEVMPVAALLTLCLVLTVFAGPVMNFMQEAGGSLHPADAYIREVLQP